MDQEPIIEEIDNTQERVNQENLTYYYSKFDLFDSSKYFYFTKYEIFKKNLQNALGEDWNKYAKETLYKLDEYSKKNYVPNEEIYHFSLEIWLELRKEINLQRISSNEDSENHNWTECQFEENQIFEVFEKNVRKRFSDYFINESLYKAVLQGFYATANKIWKETIETENTVNFSGFEPEENDLHEGGKFDFIKNKLKSFTENTSQSYIIKPMLIASEKIMDYFSYSKKKQENNVDKSIEVEKDLYNEKKNVVNFHSNFQNEASEELKNKLNNLSLEDNNEKLSNLNRKRNFNEVSPSKSVINVKRFSKNEEKQFLNPIFIDSTSQYIENFMKTSKEKWQVARGFVTNMIEVNYNRISHLEVKLSLKANDLKNHIKIRFLQPAQTFYHHLMKVWIIFKTNDYQNNISFSEYLEVVKKSMGDSWSEKYLKPTQVFFETLFTEWNKLQEESKNEENLKLFIRRVREDLLNIWEENIIKKIEHMR